MRPFLRWAGGKRWLAQRSSIQIPEGARLVEPFLGGGALFFSREWPEALLSDVNPFLINTYRWMKEDHSSLFAMTKEHFQMHSEEWYYEVRSRMSHSSIEDAADFIYLNRSCFNGLFRVNLSGRFNVPIGSKSYELNDESEFKKWSDRLASADVQLRDFEETIDLCGEGDFVFADPPYTVNHNANGFIEYNEKIFSWDDQVRLHDCLLRAEQRGVRFTLTNADHATVRDLYSDCSISTVERGSEMAGRTSARGRTSEVVITQKGAGSLVPDLFSDALQDHLTPT